MANSRGLYIPIVVDPSRAKRGFNDVESAAKKFGRHIEGVSRGSRGTGLDSLATLTKAGGVAAGLGLGVQLSRQFADAASDLNEQVNKTETIFGGSSDEISAWSKTTASAFGISRTEALSAAGAFGQLLETSGLTRREAAGMSRGLVELGSDIASFNNIDPADALLKLRSGLAGEAEPLRQVGVLLSETRVKQEAYRLGIVQSGATLTEAQKVQARYSLILKDTTSAQGDFSRTSGGLANQQRILRARFADTRAELGGRLLPIMLKATEAANDLLASFETPTADATLLNSPDFARKFLDVFGPEALRDAIIKAKPQLEKAQKEFEESLRPIKLEIQPEVKPPSFGQPGWKPGTAAEAPPAGTFITATQRNQWFDAGLARKIDRVQDIRSIGGQITSLRRIAALIQQRIAATKDITRKLSLEDRLVSVNRQIRGLTGEQASQAADAAAAEKERQIEAAAKRLERITAKEFRMLGLAADGNAVAPGKENLLKRIGTFEQNVKGTFLDTDRTRSQLARFRKVLDEALVPKTIRQKMDEMLLDLGRALREGLDKQTGPLTKTTQLSTDRILSGLGLGRDAERLLRARLSHFNSAGMALSGAGAGSLTVTVQPPDVYLDGAKISKSTSKRQARTRKLNPQQRNGPRQGVVVS